MLARFKTRKILAHRRAMSRKPPEVLSPLEHPHAGTLGLSLWLPWISTAILPPTWVTTHSEVLLRCGKLAGVAVLGAPVQYLSHET